jgi:hypothetical protein
MEMAKKIKPFFPPKSEYETFLDILKSVIGQIYRKF